MGTTYVCKSVCEGDTEMNLLSQEECIVNNGNIYGSYIHGIFDYDRIARIMIETVARKKGIELDDISEFDYARFREEQYDKLADEMRAALDMEYIYSIMNEAAI